MTPPPASSPSSPSSPAAAARSRAPADLFGRFDLETSGGRIPAMEGLRAYAVLLTFCVHFFGGWLIQFRGIDTGKVAPAALSANTDRVLVWLQLSPYGVYLFFILSGFLICRLIGNPRRFSYGHFLWRRMWRIYPAFLLALGAGVATFSIHAGYVPLTARDLAGNLVFLNAVPQFGVRPYLHQSWSLFFEAVYYLVCPVLLLLRPLGLWRGPWGVLAAGLLLVYVPWMLGWGQALFLLFFAGAAAARYDDEALAAFARRMPEPLVVIAYLAVTTAIAMKALGDHAAIWLYAVAGTLFMVKACYGEGLLNRLFAWRPLRRIGNISYSLFLLHTIPVFFVVYEFGPRWFKSTGLLPALLGAAVALAASLALAGASFLLVERPYFSKPGDRIRSA